MVTSTSKLVIPPDFKFTLPPRKRARTKEEKEQRRIERVLRNRKAAYASREKKRRYIKNLEKRSEIMDKILFKLDNNLEEIFSKDIEGLNLVIKYRKCVELENSDSNDANDNKTIKKNSVVDDDSNDISIKIEDNLDISSPPSSSNNIDMSHDTNINNTNNNIDTSNNNIPFDANNTNGKDFSFPWYFNQQLLINQESNLKFNNNNSSLSPISSDSSDYLPKSENELFYHSDSSNTSLDQSNLIINTNDNNDFNNFFDLFEDNLPYSLNHNDYYNNKSSKYSLSLTNNTIDNHNDIINNLDSLHTFKDNTNNYYQN